jgi:gamma-glutamyltranspeptidase/glutathione hydrolase
MAPHRNAYRPVVMGSRAVTTSAHPLASAAGVEILLGGGNAIDAAIAMAAALNVVEPFMSGLGGVGVMLVRSGRTRERHVLDFGGRAPAAFDVDAATVADLAGGPRACATPGSVAGWLTALGRFGSMDATRVFAPAIRLAEVGAPLSWKSCEFTAKARETLARSAEARRMFLDAGEPRPGSLLVQKELGASLREIAEGGADVFYRGPLGRAVCRSIQEAGGWLSEDDLASFTPVWRTPLIAPFRAVDLCTVPPPYSAFQFVETLNILDGYDLEGWGHNSPDYLHHLIEAITLASADRLAYADGPDVPIRGLVDRAYAAAQRTRIDPCWAAVSEGERFDATHLHGEVLPGRPADFASEHTTHFACADAEGNVVSVTQTLGAPFGSGFAVPGTGIVLNNVLKWMDVDPRSPQRLRRGRTAGTMMLSPTQIFRAGEFVMSIGTPGSYGILQTTPQMIVNALVFGMNIQEAIEAPRVRAYRDRAVDAEGRIPATTREALARRGHDVAVIEDWSWLVGGGQGIMRDGDSGVLQGGADPRRDGYAIAL